MSGLRKLLQSISRRYILYLDIRGVNNPDAVARDIEFNNVTPYLDMRGVNDPDVAMTLLADPGQNIELMQNERFQFCLHECSSDNFFYCSSVNADDI